MLADVAALAPFIQFHMLSHFRHVAPVPLRLKKQQMKSGQAIALKAPLRRGSDHAAQTALGEGLHE